MTDHARDFIRVFNTDLGWMGIAGTPSGLSRLTFGHQSSAAAREALGTGSRASYSRPDWMDDAEQKLVAYAAGEPVELELIPLDIPHRTPFEQRVRSQLLRLGYGNTISYGDLAERAGAPGAARAVGTVMSRNPVPLVIPCHRVLGAGGKLGGYSAPSGLAMKRRLLELELVSAVASVQSEG